MRIPSTLARGVIPVLCALLPPLLGAGAFAQTPIATYDGCEDAHGHPVSSEMDGDLPAVAASSVEQGRAVIRYNPRALPRLTPRARLFFFAHECARHTLGQALEGVRTERGASQADCQGIVSLVRSGLVRQDEVRELQSELTFTPEEWAWLPGPPRSFDLESCFVSALRMPGAGAPPALQREWDGCIRGCADRLRACERACGTRGCGRCQGAYDECDAACAQRFP